MGIEVVAGEREAGIGGEAYLARAHGDFESGSVDGIADQQIGGTEREAVQGAAGADAEPAMSGPAEILHGGEHAGLDDFHHLAVRSTVKRTRSPGRSKVGGVHAGSNSDREVRPSNCQPPGEASE